MFEEPITPELIVKVLNNFINEYGVTLSTANVYVNFRNEDGQAVTLLDEDGKEIESIVVKKPKNSKKSKTKNKLVI
ncbi:hypothetical protein GCM10020331_010640 [Ectobacillus funiculus]